MRRSALVLGWLWPFAAAAVAAIASGWSLRGDGEVALLALVALLGSPAVVITVARRLPEAWPEDLQSVLALLLAVPAVGAELVLASWLLAFGANVAGPGWIE